MSSSQEQQVVSVEAEEDTDAIDSPKPLDIIEENDESPSDDKGDDDAQQDDNNKPIFQRETSSTNVQFGSGNKKATLFLSRAASMVRIPDNQEEKTFDETLEEKLEQVAASEKDSNQMDAAEATEPEAQEPEAQKPEAENETVAEVVPKFDLSREFTFTGYDIMADVPPIVHKKSKKQKERDKASALYRSTCTRLGIIPASYLCQRLLEPIIKMKSHGLGPLGTKAVAIALVENSRVTSLDLEDNAIGAEGAKYISQMLEDNTAITDLGLSENLIGSEGLLPLTERLCENQFVTKLDISGNALVNKDALLIKQILENNKHLLELKASHNQFGEEGGIHLARALVTNDSLEVLDISWNHLRGKGAVAIATNLKKNIGLKRLNVSWNGFGVDGCTALGKSLKINETLQELNLASNRIETKALGPLMNGVQRNETLKILRLGQNPMTPDVCLAVLKALETSTKTTLELLDLEDIMIDPQFEELLTSIQDRLPLKVITGASIKTSETIYHKEKGIFAMDPIKLLFEYMNREGLRIIDLFTSLDRDGSRSVSHEEFREGLLSVNVPLTEDQIEQLIDKLDKDKDGEVDFSELIDGERTYKRKQLKIKMKKEEMEKQKRIEKRKALALEKQEKELLKTNSQANLSMLPRDYT